VCTRNENVLRASASGEIASFFPPPPREGRLAGVRALSKLFAGRT